MDEEEIETINERIDAHHRVLFGNEDIKDDIGTVAKVDRMYEILTSAETVIKFLDRFSTFIKWSASLLIAVGLVKLWLSGVLAHLIANK